MNQEKKLWTSKNPRNCQHGNKKQETKEVLGIFTEVVEISAKEINVQNFDEVKALIEWV